MNTSLLTLTVIAAAALTNGRFVTAAGTLPAAGGKALGVARFDAAIGDPVAVDTLGTGMAEAAATIAVDDVLMVDAAGKVTPLTGSAKHSVGRALTGGVAGALVEVLLLPSNGIPTA